MNKQKYQFTNIIPNETAASEVYPSRTLEIQHQGKLSSSIDVRDVGNSRPLYTIKTKTFKPQLTFTSCSDNQTLAIVEHHNFSRKIDITLRGQSTTIKPERKPKSTYTYTSPTTSAVLTWKFDRWTSMDMVCLDERGMALARFRYAEWTMTKLGTLEIVGHAAAGGQMFEELVVTCVTVVDHWQREAVAGAAAAVA
ncbi:hypothetical protein LTR70_008387 [Exophiala xenobiotica]|uniref:DUF6593 domain-containing protein n=1 Tax=Lithohypha guttulata TaxID=1690604 RepID=A0ABR0K1Q6_9EURO|nr:hypothetical protein LTR24_007999 [Lithohypha guttulata]KAK5312128.1 hypothetical protein LTR70_008387 [Exophiala xenobiotica]